MPRGSQEGAVAEAAESDGPSPFSSEVPHASSLPAPLPCPNPVPTLSQPPTNPVPTSSLPAPLPSQKHALAALFTLALYRSHLPKHFSSSSVAASGSSTALISLSAISPPAAPPRPPPPPPSDSGDIELVAVPPAPPPHPTANAACGPSRGTDPCSPSAGAAVAQAPSAHQDDGSDGVSQASNTDASGTDPGAPTSKTPLLRASSRPWYCWG